MTEIDKKIIISGEGGQGIQTIARILSLSIYNHGHYCSYIPEFGPEQRGSPSIAFVQMSKEEIAYPLFDKADILVILRERAIPRINRYISSKTNIIFDSTSVRESVVKQKINKKFGIPATKISSDQFGSKNFNLIILGYLSKILNLSERDVWIESYRHISKKITTEEQKNQAMLAFTHGYDFTPEKQKFSKTIYSSGKGIIITKNTERKAIVSPELCKGCGICIEKCPVGALKFGNEIGVYGNPIPEIDVDKCINCGNCFRFCPDCAISVKKNN